MELVQTETDNADIDSCKEIKPDRAWAPKKPSVSLAQETDTIGHVVTIGFEMLLELLEKHWIRVERIGADAEKRGEKIGMKPSWEDGHLIEPSRTATKAMEKRQQPRKTAS